MLFHSQRLADGVLFVAGGAPAVFVDAAAEFADDAAADVDLIAGLALGAGLVAEIDAAVVFAVLVEKEVEGQLEVLVLVFGVQHAGARGVAVLRADDDAVFDPPHRAANGRPAGEVFAIEERTEVGPGSLGSGGQRQGNCHKSAKIMHKGRKNRAGCRFHDVNHTTHVLKCRKRPPMALHLSLSELILVRQPFF